MFMLYFHIVLSTWFYKFFVLRECFYLPLPHPADTYALNIFWTVPRLKLPILPQMQQTQKPQKIIFMLDYVTDFYVSVATG